MIVDNRKMLEDKVWRAFGTLRETRTISSEETMELLSLVRLGVNLGLIPNVPINRVNDLFLLTQPAHLQKLEGRPLKPQDRDVARANLLRGKLQG
jgi:protein arginine kinase